MYDSIIIGGGMIGAALAASLKENHIALIDAAPFSNKEDPRLIALTHTSICFLKTIEIWNTLEKKATPINQIHVSHQGTFGITRIHHQEVNLPTLGYLIPAKYINAALEEKLKTLSHIEIIRPSTLLSLTQQNDCVTIEIEKANQRIEMQTKKLIAADGTHSTVRTLLNIPTEKIDYDQSAIVTITQLQRSHHFTAYQRFLEEGAIAMLPMPNDCVATIWTDQNDKIYTLMQMNDEIFLENLQKAFGYRLGKLKQIAHRYQFPLQFIATKENVKQNVILIGNAAHTIHPVAAQGLNLALQEVAQLSGLINENQALTMAPNAFTVKLSHYLHTLFSTDFFILNTCRQLGLVAFDTLSSAKRVFINKTMGKDKPWLQTSKNN